MLRFFYRAVGDMETATDLRQELFVRLYLKSKTYRGDGSFSAWLYGIAANLVRAHFRKARRLFVVRDSEPDEQAEFKEALDGSVRADEAARRSERSRFLREMLAALSPRDRQVLMLRFFGSLSFREISQALGMTEVTARVHALRGIKRLRDLAVERGLTSGDLL